MRWIFKGPLSSSINMFLILGFWLLGNSIQVMGQESSDLRRLESSKKFSLKNIPFELHGFVHSRHAIRLMNDPYHTNDFVLSETRWQLALSDFNKLFEWKIKNDFIYDSFSDEFKLDLRECNLDLNTPYWLGIKIGRQILTWGKGDMLFVNDLFPKDWQSFFVGRELEYLKGPSDALKVSFFVKRFELNLIYTPSFNSDIFPTGERLSFYDGTLQNFRGDENQIDVEKRLRWFKDDEFNWRLRRNIGSFDLAFYGYYGFWKSPAGVNLSSGKPYSPEMVSHGLSFEGGLFSGVFSTEMALYSSTEDKDGSAFNIANSNFRILVGQNFDLKKEWSIGLQYYGELTLDYDEFKANFPSPESAPNQLRDMVTLRIGKNLFKQKANLSLFTYYGIAENDTYIRMNISYKIKDDWKIDFGSNLFFGENDNSFWGQFGNNNNVYLGLKWSY